MMKKILLVAVIFVSISAFAQINKKIDTRRNMLIITCHPDDWELSMAGTAYLLKDKCNIHVIIASDGERGNSKKPDPKIATLRREHAEKSAKKINAKNYFFKMNDGAVYANKESVDKTVKLLEKLDPALIFLHWPMDKPDHIAASAMAMMALSKTGMMYNREVYYFEVGLLNYFEPDVYVDISSIWKIKKELVSIHERFGDDRYVRMTEKSAIHHGYKNKCKYAEVFKPLFPLSNIRFKNRIKCSLLDL